jgi:aspartokinase-like uncharacterized kinase
MEAVIKVGGSLSENSKSLQDLGVEFSRISKSHQVVFVPGGGGFADVVRRLDEKFSLPALVSHKLAITAMDQFGLFLNQVIPHAVLCDSLEKANTISKKGKATIFLPSKLLSKLDPFEPSWDVTSDSIAAYVAVRLKAAKIIFVTNVDGIFSSDPKKSSQSELIPEISLFRLKSFTKPTSVDKFLPIFLTENKLNSYIVNGHFPQRIKDILHNKTTICTRIVQ